MSLFLSYYPQPALPQISHLFITYDQGVMSIMVSTDGETWVDLYNVHVEIHTDAPTHEDHYLDKPE